MKPTTFTFDIPTPCHEKWGNMDQRPDGRFCHSCQKTVVDFSQKTDREVAAHFQKINENVCGKFRKDQLQRPVHFEQPKTVGGWLRALGLLVPGLLVGTAAAGQTNKIHPTEQLEKQLEESMRGYVVIRPVKQVRGVVKDENGELLIGVSIVLSGTSIGTVTSIDGSYELNIPFPANGMPIVLKFSYTGFTTKEVILDTAVSEQKDVMLDIDLQANYGLIGELVIVRKDQTLYNITKHKIRDISHYFRSKIKAKRKEKSAKKEAVKKGENMVENNAGHLIKKENEYSGKIFPNPFFNNINIEINCPKNEPLNIRLLDLNGRIVFLQKYQAEIGVNKILLSPELQNMPSGNYLLEVSGSGGLFFAEMVVYANSF